MIIYLIHSNIVNLGSNHNELCVFAQIQFVLIFDCLVKGAYATVAYSVVYVS